MDSERKNKNQKLYRLARSRAGPEPASPHKDTPERKVPVQAER